MICNLYTVAKNHKVFAEYKEAFRISMGELGHTVNIVKLNEKYKADILPEKLNFFIIGNRIVLPEFLAANREINKTHRILLLFEQWNSEKKQLEIRKQFNCTFDIFELSYKKYKSDYKSVYCPLGWSKAYETDLLKKEEIIDCYSFGSYTPIRQSYVKQYPFIKFDKAIFGKKRDATILSSKVNIIIPAHQGYYFPPLRYLTIACKKKFVMSTPHVSYSPFIPNKHFKMFKNYNYWICEDKERCEFAENVYNDLKMNYNYTISLKEALKQI